MKARKRNDLRIENAIRAFAVDRHWGGAPLPMLDSSHEFDFILVSSASQYEEVLRRQLEPILVTRDFSVTDRRGKLRLRLGTLIEPWRWRRTLLNEGVDVLYVSRGTLAVRLRLAAILARVPVEPA